MTRAIPDINWTKKYEVGDNCMAIITTGFYDDTQVWEDNKTWWDNGEAGITWTKKTEGTLVWN